MTKGPLAWAPADAAAIEVKLIEYVGEYLQFHGCTRALEAFEAERHAIEARAANSGGAAPGAPKESQGVAFLELMRAFELGAREDFFRLWEKHIPVQVRRNDPEAQKVEFYLQIYFAVYPTLPEAQRHSPEANRNMPLHATMAYFKTFLETRGQDLARTGEFLAYYALPFVSNPREHPSFRALYDPAWVQGTRATLEAFLDRAPEDTPTPRLFNILCHYYGLGADVAAPSGGGNPRGTSALLKGEADLKDLVPTPRIPPQVHTPPPAVPEPIASTSPMKALGGRGGGPVSNEFGGTINLGDSFNDLVAGSGGLIIRHSVQFQQGQGIESKPGTAEGTKSKTRSAFQQSVLAPLDFDKVRADLADSSSARVSRLLQALRWRVSRSPPGDDRHRVVQSIASADALGVTAAAAAGDAPAAEVDAVLAKGLRPQLECLRLLNTLASDATGRRYLLGPGGGPGVVPALAAVALEMDPAEDTPARQHALGALQKLSLRRGAARRMVLHGLVPWVAGMLLGGAPGSSRVGLISEYSVEYGAALLMNLSLLPSGKHACAAPGVDILEVLSGLLESPSAQVRTYANGALYSVLQLRRLREKARALGFGDLLRELSRHSDAVFVRQLQFILEQLEAEGGEDDEVEESTGEHEKGNVDEDEWEDDDEQEDELYEEEEEEEEEEGLRVGDTAAAGGAANKEELLNGEELLCAEYILGDGKAAMAAARQTASFAAREDERKAAHRPANVLASVNGPLLQKPATPSIRASYAGPSMTDLGAASEEFSSKDKLPRTPDIPII